MRTYVHERVRQAPLDDKVRTKFDWREFVRLAHEGDEDGGRTLRDRIDTARWYARIHLESLGKPGAARAAYLLNSRRALKVALDVPGLEQNVRETAVSMSASSDVPIARVHAHDPEHIWIVSDLVKPVKSEHEFFELTNIDLSDLSAQLEDLQAEKAAGRKITKGFVGDETVWGAWRAVEEGELALLDVDELGHWGVTPDRRVVLLDYGYTQEMYDSLPGFMRTR